MIKRVLQYGCAIGALMLAGQAAAQSAALATAPAAAPATSGAELDEVVVTARRREERLQDVPVAVTALGGEALRAAQVVNAKELVALVPSLNVNSGNAREGNRFTIRGQGVTLGAGEGVVVYLAEAPMPQFGAGGPGLYLDLENLQVLNGPQGTLFGRNTTGGAVLFTPRRPTDYNEGYIQAGYGNYNNREVAGVLNFVAVPDKLKFRFAGEYRGRDGYTKNLYDGRDYDDLNYYDFRVGVTFTPTDDLQNYLLVQYNKSQPHGTGSVITMVNPNFAVRGNIPALQAALAAQQARGIRTTNFDSRGFWQTKSLSVVNTTTYDLTTNISVKNIFSYFDTDNKNGFDVDGSPVPLLVYRDGRYVGNTSAVAFSHMRYYNDELQLSGRSSDGKVTWVGGIFYQKYEPSSPTFLDQLLFGGPQLLAPVEHGDSKAFYGQFTANLGKFSSALDKFNLTAGYRYTWDSKDAISNQWNPVTQVCIGQATKRNPDCQVPFHGDFSAGTYTLSLDYHLNDRTLFYVTQRTGYKSGGFNTSTLPGQGFAAFGPEKVLDRELGMKSDFSVAGRPVRLNIAAFRDNYKSIQRNQSVLVPPVPPATTPSTTNLVLNAGAGIIQGAELQTTVNLTDRLQVQANYSYLDAHYTTYVLPGNINRAGVMLPYSPKHKVGASVRYNLPISENLGTADVSVNYAYQSHFRAQDPDSPGNIIGDYALVNLNAEWKNIAGSKVDAEVFVTNLFDKEYIQQNYAYYNVFGTVAVLYGEPRMYGMRLRYNF